MRTESGGRPRSGIITFAGVLFLLVGSFNVVDGLVAALDPEWFKAGDMLITNIQVWGVLMVMVGILQAITGYAVLQRSRAGQIFGICLAGLNALTHMLFIAHFPAWSLVIMAIDVAIIYVLTVHDDEFID